MADEHRDQIRIVQETVAGKEITFAHIMGGPAPIIYPGRASGSVCHG